MREKTQTGGRAEGPVYLIGFMGVGKTTVSHALCSLLGTEEIDLDEEIEREAGMPVAEIFARFGEEDFRDRETAMLQKIAERGPVIVSCGGGCVLREKNADILRQTGTTVLLTAEPETICERVKGETHRPLLSGRMDPGSIAALMEQRRAAYEAAGDLRISTDGRTPEEIAEEILRTLSK